MSTADAVLVLPSRVDVDAIVDVHAALVDALAATPRGLAVHLDAGAVATLDAAGAQLLVAVARAAAARDQPLAWRAVSDAARAAIAALGLDGELAFPPPGARA